VTKGGKPHEPMDVTEAKIQIRDYFLTPSIPPGPFLLLSFSFFIIIIIIFFFFFFFFLLLLLHFVAVAAVVVAVVAVAAVVDYLFILTLRG
jgi:hypothetical protein